MVLSANGAATLTASAEGKYLSFQWQKDGTDLVGETNATLVFSDFNGTQDEGNYTITVTNDFGSVISAPVEVKEQQ
jgi:membrane carboxypeptidase/penicillin-binding protein PbpC